MLFGWHIPRDECYARSDDIDAHLNNSDEPLTRTKQSILRKTWLRCWNTVKTPGSRMADIVKLSKRSTDTLAERLTGQFCPFSLYLFHLMTLRLS